MLFCSCLCSFSAARGGWEVSSRKLLTNRFPLLELWTSFVDTDVASIPAELQFGELDEAHYGEPPPLLLAC